MKSPLSGPVGCVIVRDERRREHRYEKERAAGRPAGPERGQLLAVLGELRDEAAAGCVRALRVPQRDDDRRVEHAGEAEDARGRERTHVLDHGQGEEDARAQDGEHHVPPAEERRQVRRRRQRRRRVAHDDRVRHAPDERLEGADPGDQVARLGVDDGLPRAPVRRRARRRARAPDEREAVRGDGAEERDETARRRGRPLGGRVRGDARGEAQDARAHDVLGEVQGRLRHARLAARRAAAESGRGPRAQGLADRHATAAARRRWLQQGERRRRADGDEEEREPLRVHGWMSSSAVERCIQ